MRVRERGERTGDLVGEDGVEDFPLLDLFLAAHGAMVSGVWHSGVYLSKWPRMPGAGVFGLRKRGDAVIKIRL